MRITVLVRPTHTVLRLEENFVYDGRKDFNACVEQAKQAGCRHLVVDLEQVNCLDSAALGIIALTGQQFRLEQRRFSLMRPQPHVRKLLAIVQFDKLMSVYDSEAAARAA